MAPVWGPVIGSAPPCCSLDLPSFLNPNFHRNYQLALLSSPPLLFLSHPTIISYGLLCQETSHMSIKADMFSTFRHSVNSHTLTVVLQFNCKVG